MRQVVTTMCVLSMMFTGVSAANADATSSPGKQAAYSSVSGVAATPSEVVATSVQIEKGKKKRVLEVQITGFFVPSADGVVIGVRPVVNGFAFEPGGYLVTHGCDSAFISCTVSGNFWIDLDVAEAASPGTFINQPLNVDAMVVTGSGSESANISLQAKLVKK
jgi:hypothetical protein